MDTPRVGTSHSQRSFIPLRELEHSAPEVVQHPILAPPPAFPVYEKKAEQAPTPSYFPAVPEQQRQPYWAPSEFEPVPPQYSTHNHYPGVPHSQPAALVVPPIPHRAETEGTLCGMRRRLCIILLATGGLLLLAIAVGVGVGVGIGGKSGYV